MIILDEFKEELDEFKAISLIYEGGLGEFKEELDKSDEGGSRCVEGALDEFTENSTSRIEVQSFVWTVGLDKLVDQLGELGQLGAMTLTWFEF